MVETGEGPRQAAPRYKIEGPLKLFQLPSGNWLQTEATELEMLQASRIAELSQALRNLKGPTSWWDSELRTCRYCGSTNFAENGLLIHKSTCEIVRAEALLEKPL